MAKISKARFHQLALDDEERLTAGHAHHRAPAWSRDGKLLAFIVGSIADSNWVVVDRRGRVARVLEGPAAGSASFAPDGRLVFERRFGATSEVWLTPGGDAPPVRLLGGDGRLYRDPAFSPDGATLACAIADEPHGRTQLHLVAIDSGRRIALPADEQRSDARPAFTPDGDELVFEGVTGDDHAIYALHLGTNAVTRVTPAGERARHPAVVDTGILVYERQPEVGASSLVLLDRTRGRAQVLVEDGASRGGPAAFCTDRGRVKLAYSAQPAPGEHDATEPPRFDIHVARLHGVTIASEHAAAEAAT